MGSIVWIIVVATSVWVYFDAKSIGARKGLMNGFFNLGPLGWGLSCLGIWIIAFPTYLVKRSEIRIAAKKDHPEYEDSPDKIKQSIPITPAVNPLQAYNDNASRTCPYCAEIIKKEAIYCRFCNNDLLPNQKSKPSPESSISEGDWENIGRQHLRNGIYAEAVAAFNRAIDETKIGELFYARAVAYSKMKDSIKMKSDLQLAADLGHEKARTTLIKISDIIIPKITSKD